MRLGLDSIDYIIESTQRVMKFDLGDYRAYLLVNGEGEHIKRSNRSVLKSSILVGFTRIIIITVA